MDGKYYTKYLMDSLRNKRIICKDGTTLSVQTGVSLYCSPRENVGPYESVEVGFIADKEDNPIAPPDSWIEYADGGFPNDVYAYVPVELVAEFIESHGGYDTLSMLREGFVHKS